MKILYIEDDQFDAKLTAVRLKKSVLNFDLEVVNSQAEAESFLKKGKYDLVLTDLSLSQGSGLSLLAHIREAGIQVPVVLITGRGDEDTVVAALKAGADDYIFKQKPYLEKLPQILNDAYKKFQSRKTHWNRTIHVLYGERNNADIDLTQRHLSRYAPHIHMDAVLTGKAVLKKLVGEKEKKPYDILLLNLNMPDLNALELIKEISQTHQLKVPVIVVTGHGNEETALQVLKLGAVNYLVKNPGYLYNLPTMIENVVFQSEISRKEAEFRTLVETINEGLANLNADGNFTFVNQHLCDILGKTPDELLGKPCLEIIAKPQQQQYKQNLRQCITGAGTTFETTLKGKGGRGLPVILAIGSQMDAAGNLIKLVLAVTDISQRVLVEKELEESLAQYHQFFHDNPEYCYFVSPEGIILEINKIALKTLGYTREEIVGKQIETIYAPESRKKAGNLLFKSLKERDLSDEEMVIITKSGEKRTVLLSATKVVLDGELDHSISIQKDITERRTAEEALAIQQHETSQMLNQMLNAFVLFESVFDKSDNFVSYRFLYINQAYEKITGVKNEEVRGKTIHEVWPETEPEWIRRYGQVAMTGESQEFELYHHPTEKLYHCQVYRPFDTSEKFCVIFEDVTERRRIENERQQLMEKVIQDSNELEKRIQQRTKDYQDVINLTTDREIRMSELKKVIKKLRAQLFEVGLEPVANDPLNLSNDEP